MNNQHIVIVGAGFAGLMAATRLGRKRGQHNIDITLINASDEYIIRPKLHEWATNQTHNRQKIVDILEGTGVNFVQGWVSNLLPDQNQVQVNTNNEEKTIHYDKLILALGSRVDTKTVKGVSDYAYVLDAHAERGAEALRQELLTYAGERPRVVVIGGGATGIEGATHVKSLNPDFDVTIVTRETLGSFKDDVRVEREIQAAFAEQDITVYDNKTVREIQAEQVILESGETIPYDVCLWAGGFVAPPLARQSGLQVNAQNQVLIDPYQRALDYPNIIAVGDCAFPIEEPGSPYRMCCPVAMAMGAHAADNIVRQLNNRPEEPLSFAHYGQGIQLGINDAIGWAGYPDDKVHLTVTRGKLALGIRKVILASLDVIFDYEKRYGVFSWLGKKRYEQQKQKSSERAKQLSNQSA